MLSPAPDSTTETTTHSSSDEDSPRPSSPDKQDVARLHPPSADMALANTASAVSVEETPVEVSSEPQTAILTVRPTEVSLDQQQKTEDSQAEPSCIPTPAVTSAMAPNVITPNTLAPLASNAIRPVGNSEHTPYVQRNCSILSRKTSSGSLFVSLLSHGISVTVFSIFVILGGWELTCREIILGYLVLYYIESLIY